MEGRTPDHAGRTAVLFSPGNQHDPDLAGGVSVGFAPDRGLIGSIIALLGLDLAVPDHSTLSRRVETLEVPRDRPGTHPIHLLVDSTGLQLCGPGEWLADKHGSRARRSWCKLHIGVDAATGRIVAPSLTASDVDDASQIGSLLGQVEGPITSFTADGACNQDGVYGELAARHPDASVVVPPRICQSSRQGCPDWRARAGMDRLLMG